MSWRTNYLGGATIAALMLGLCASSTGLGATLLNERWLDGDRTNTNLPGASATWIGQSAGNGSNSVTPGSLNFELPTNSLKAWTYFTSNNTAPDGAQPHNAVTQLAVGDVMTASMTFELPDGATAANTSKNFRFGLFHDPTDARVQSNTNSDGGGGTSPWADAKGYVVQLPINSTSSGNNPLQIGKRTANNTSLLGASGAYTFAPTGGTAFAIAADTLYTVDLTLAMISATQLDVTATVRAGDTVLSTLTVSDTGTTFGGVTPPVLQALPGNNAIYTNFDQMFWRNSDSTQVFDPDPVSGVSNGRLRFTNWRIVLNVPEPATSTLLGMASLALAFVRRGSR